MSGSILTPAHPSLGALPALVFIRRGIAEVCRLPGARDAEDVAGLGAFTQQPVPACRHVAELVAVDFRAPRAITRVLALVRDHPLVLGPGAHADRPTAASLPRWRPSDGRRPGGLPGTTVLAHAVEFHQLGDVL